MQTFIVDCLLLGWLYVVTGEEVVYCPAGSYQSQTSGQCEPCSLCPANKIVRETCSGNRDTQCGSFREFKMFQNSNTLKLLHSSRRAEKKPENNTENVVTTEADENASWHGITMAMIALLCVTGIMFVSFISVVCYKNRHQNKEGLIAQVDKDSDLDRPDDRYQRATTSREHPPNIEQFEIAIDT